MAEEVQAASTAAATAVAEPSPAEETQPLEQPAAEQPTEAIPEGQPTQEAEETELNLEEAPETSGDYAKYKEIFKDHPELGSDWRTILGREAAFSGLGQFSEVKGIVERVPTLEDAEILSSQAENHRLLGETYRTDPVGFVESLQENDPNAFATLTRQLPEILAQTDTQAYQEQARFYTNAVLDNLWAMAQQSGDQELLTAIQTVAGKGLSYRLGTQSSRQTAQPTSEVAKLRQELSQLKNQGEQGQVEEFWSGLDGAFTEAMIEDIEAGLKKALPTATPAQLSRMVPEAWDMANDKLRSQPQTASQAAAFRKNAERGRRSLADYNSALSYLKNRGKLVVPGVIKTVAEEWSKQVLQLNTEQIAKRKGIADRTRDAGQGVQASSSTGAPVNGKPVKKTFNSVMESLSKGTYQPPARAARN